MKRSILIAGADYPELLLKARALDLRAVLVTPEHGAASACGAADNVVTADITSPDELVRVARAHAVHGVCAGNDQSLLAAAEAAQRLALPGPVPRAVKLMQDITALRAVIARRGGLCPASGIAASPDEARTVARDMGLPVNVGPAHARPGRRTWRVEYIEDLSLAYAQAVKGADTPGALIEQVVPGPRYYVDCVVNGAITVAGIVGRLVSDAPFDFDEALFAPPELDAAARDEIAQAAQSAADAIGAGCGCVRVDLAVTPEGPCVFGVRMWRPSRRVPADLILPAYGLDLLSASLRLAVGDAVEVTSAPGPAWALRWISSGSGVVTGVENLDAARAVPGVCAVETFVSQGDVVGHIVDETSRDRIGYALATGETATAALATSAEACGLCRVVTKPSRDPAAR